MLARIARSLNFSFNTAIAKSAGNENAAHILQLRSDAVLERFGIDQFQIDPAILTRGRVGERFVNALVRVLEMNVFPNDRDLDALLRADHAIDEFLPTGEIGLGRF